MSTGTQDLYSCGCTLVSFESTCTYIRCQQHKDFTPRLLERHCDSCNRLKNTAIELTKVSSFGVTNASQFGDQNSQGQANVQDPNGGSSIDNLTVNEDRPNRFCRDSTGHIKPALHRAQEEGYTLSNQVNVDDSESTSAQPIQSPPPTLSTLGPSLVSLTGPFLKSIINLSKNTASAEITSRKQATIDAMYTAISSALVQATSLRDIDVNCERATVKQWIADIKEGKATLQDMEWGLFVEGEAKDLGRGLIREKLCEGVLQECMKTLDGYHLIKMDSATSPTASEVAQKKKEAAGRLLKAAIQASLFKLERLIPVQVSNSRAQEDAVEFDRIVEAMLKAVDDWLLVA
ncbi:hypothetical protein VTL71DRAFT_202 [Oculimacula yallundae]|uniref:Uncharacterized protein n=1 Tax=Oculimacula yallundae TaxID=86028 RepID=A0ABR4D1Q4_9HELO